MRVLLFLTMSPPGGSGSVPLAALHHHIMAAHQIIYTSLALFSKCRSGLRFSCAFSYTVKTTPKRPPPSTILSVALGLEDLVSFFPPSLSSKSMAPPKKPKASGVRPSNETATGHTEEEGNDSIQQQLSTDTGEREETDSGEEGDTECHSGSDSADTTSTFVTARSRSSINHRSARSTLNSNNPLEAQHASTTNELGSGPGHQRLHLQARSNCLRIKHSDHGANSSPESIADDQPRARGRDRDTQRPPRHQQEQQQRPRQRQRFTPRRAPPPPPPPPFPRLHLAAPPSLSAAPEEWPPLPSQTNSHTGQQDGRGHQPTTTGPSRPSNPATDTGTNSRTSGGAQGHSQSSQHVHQGNPAPGSGAGHAGCSWERLPAPRRRPSPPSPRTAAADPIVPAQTQFANPNTSRGTEQPSQPTQPPHRNSPEATASNTDTASTDGGVSFGSFRLSTPPRAPWVAAVQQDPVTPTPTRPSALRGGSNRDEDEDTTDGGGPSRFRPDVHRRVDDMLSRAEELVMRRSLHESSEPLSALPPPPYVNPFGAIGQEMGYGLAYVHPSQTHRDGPARPTSGSHRVEIDTSNRRRETQAPVPVTARSMIMPDGSGQSTARPRRAPTPYPPPSVTAAAALQSQSRHVESTPSYGYPALVDRVRTPSRTRGGPIDNGNGGGEGSRVLRTTHPSNSSSQSLNPNAHPLQPGSFPQRRSRHQHSAIEDASSGSEDQQ